MSRIDEDGDLVFHGIFPVLPVRFERELWSSVAAVVAPVAGLQPRILAERLSEAAETRPSAMGEGIALSHLSVSGLSGRMTFLFRLKSPLDFACSPDRTPVDLLCLMMTPEREGSVYLQSMARLSRILRDSDVCSALRKAADEADMRRVFAPFRKRKLVAA